MTCLRKIRTASGLSQAQLSEKSRVKQSVISDIENEKTKAPRIDTILKLADALGCTVTDLLMEERKQ